MYHYFHNKIILFACLLSVLCVFSGCGISYMVNSNSLDKKDAKEFILEKKAIASLSKIDIDTRLADIELIPSDKYCVEIYYLYWNDKPDYYVKDGILHFDDNKAFPHSYSLNFNPHNYIKVYLPENAKLKEVELNNSSGDITADGFTSDLLKLNDSYGDLSMDNAAAYDATINLSSGTSSMKNISFGKLSYDNSYGDAKFININGKENSLPDNQKFEKFHCEMSSGDMTIKGLNSDSIKLNNSYGDVNCDKLSGSQLDANLSSGDFEISNSDLKNINVDNSYGGAAFYLTGSLPDYNMDLGTSYGKIRIDGKSYKDHVTINNNSSKQIKANLSSGDIGVNFDH